METTDIVDLTTTVGFGSHVTDERPVQANSGSQLAS